MSYQVTWTEGTKEILRTAFPKMEKTDRREWLIEKITDHVAREIALYPMDSSAQPGQRATGELRVGTFRVSYEIRMDAGVAIVTGVESDDTSLPQSG